VVVIFLTDDTYHQVTSASSSINSTLGWSTLIASFLNIVFGEIHLLLLYHTVIMIMAHHSSVRLALVAFSRVETRFTHHLVKAC